MNNIICISDLILLSSSVEERVSRLLEAGVSHIELLADGGSWNDTSFTYTKMLSFLRNADASFTIHPPAWDTNLTSENKTIREASLLEYRKSIEFAHIIGAEHVVIHPGFCYSPGFNKQVAQERALDAVGELCRIASALDVELAVENVGYGGASLFTQAEYIAFVRQLDKTATYLIDTGHAHLNGWNIAELICSAGERLSSIHLHDNHADKDAHLPIEEGTIQWAPIFEEMKQLNNNCRFILEYAPGTSIKIVLDSMDLLKEKLG